MKKIEKNLKKNLKKNSEKKIWKSKIHPNQLKTQEKHVFQLFRRKKKKSFFGNFFFHGHLFWVFLFFKKAKFFATFINFMFTGMLQDITHYHCCKNTNYVHLPTFERKFQWKIFSRTKVRALYIFEKKNHRKNGKKI